MSLLNILTIPDQRLREKSREIRLDEIKNLRPLILDMMETMSQAQGIGLAANQVGQNIRLVVINKDATTDKKDLILINPKISKHGWRKVKEDEGCLSIPNVQVPVSRYKKITVKALSQEGKPLDFTASDLFARVIQHEIDHLDGVLIIDKQKK